jgi:1-acyl-sn-glycerol-3-phosphate acyltransferase
MNQFDDIRPYRDNEVRPVIDRLLKDDEFLKVITRFKFPKLPPWLISLITPFVRSYLQSRLKNVETVNDLQLIIEVYVARMVRETTKGLSYSGEENLDKNKSHLFISNHRDIVVDPALVNWTLHHLGHHTLHIAIGDNLLTKPYVSDLMRLNKSFIVNRSATKPREKLKAAKHLSSYIHHCIAEEDANVWIAQREGRAKDGIDRTNSAVIGMLALSKPKAQPLADYIRELNIIPVSISYENDPCDLDKAKELHAIRSHGSYEKDEHEDAHSIAKGIVGNKGHVHLSFGEPLNGDYQSTDEIVAELDRKIIQNYILHPSNCVAYEELHGTLPEGVTATQNHIPFSDGGFLKESQRFHCHLAECSKEYRDILLAMYANPITSLQSLEH